MRFHLLLVTQCVVLCWHGCLLQAQQTGDQQTNIISNQGSSYFFYQRPEYPKDCAEIRDQCSSDTSSGVYLIKPDGYLEPFEVYCDNNNLEGWTVILRRNGGFLDFQRHWDDYQAGFGFLSQDFWLGNEKLSHVTNQKNYELHVNITNADGLSCYLTYSLFRIMDEVGNYKIANLGHYTGNVGNCYSLCLSNMQPGDCSCQRTCANPSGCLNTCSFDNICVCSEGFLLKGGECVTLDKCTVSGCILDGTEIKDGEIYTNADCTMRAICNNGQLVINGTYMCSSNEVCDDRNNVRKCYNDTISGCIVDSIEIAEGENYVNADCTMRAVCSNSQLIMDDTYKCSSNEVCDERNNVRQCYSKGNDCHDIYNAGFAVSGVYTIAPTDWSGPPFQVFCNMTDDGGWTVLQRRIDGSVDFYRNWNTYKQGFGFAGGEYWLGNDKLYHLTNQRRQVLRIDLVNLVGSPYYAKFDFFQINNETDNYRLSELGTYSGTAGAYPLIDHRAYQFSTYDQDNDIHGTVNCAENYRGGWWYYNCHRSNLNGAYGTIDCVSRNIWWASLPQSNCNTFVEMKIRPF